MTARRTMSHRPTSDLGGPASDRAFDALSQPGKDRAADILRTAGPGPASAGVATPPGW